MSAVEGRSPADDDVPVSVDFRRADQAREGAAAAMTSRPWRADFFAAFVSEIAALDPGQGCRVLELGAGPGFLAERLLASNPRLDYVALDFSGVMHELAIQRLGALAARARFVERDLRHPDWANGLGRFDAVVTHQAVHELRHKRHAAALHAQVRPMLRPGDAYLVCDHFFGEGGMSNDRLYMTVDEQRAALLAAGYAQVDQVLLKGGLVLHRAR